MLKKLQFAALTGIAVIMSTAGASALCSSYPNALSNGTVADASQVMANFNCAALTSGATLNGATFAGTTGFPGSTRFDLSGNLGIGVTPAYPLDIGGSVVSGLTARIRNGNASGYSSLRLWNDQNINVRALEIDYAGSTYASPLLVGGPTGEAASIATTGAYPLVLGSNNTARVIITSVGNVGIANASPAARLDVYDTITIQSGVQKSASYTIGGTTGALYQTLGLQSVPQTGSNPYIAASGFGFVNGVNQASPVVWMYNQGGNAFRVVAKSYGTDINSDSVLMEVKPSGYVGIGTTSPSYTLHVNGSVAGTSAYNNLSDIRLKKNIRPISDALTLISKMQGVSFDWRSPAEREVGKSFKLPSEVHQIGFIAQDLGKVLPEAVSTAADRDAIMSVAESKVVPVLVEAVKELTRENAALQAANSQQASELGNIQIRMTTLERQLRVTAWASGSSKRTN